MNYQVDQHQYLHQHQQLQQLLQHLMQHQLLLLQRQTDHNLAVTV
jgi:hypothetical protein